MRVARHPKGLAPHIVNRGEWRAHLLERLDHQIDASADAGLIALRDELAGYGGRTDAHDRSEANGIAVPLILDTPRGRVRLVSPVPIFGTPGHRKQGRAGKRGCG